MTRMLIRVVDAQEAAQAATAGIDLIEFCLIHANEPELATARAIRAAFPRVLRLRVDELCLSPEILNAVAGCHAEELALPLSCTMSSAPVLRPLTDPEVGLVANFAVGRDAPDALTRMDSRYRAIMFEAGSAARLLDVANIAQLDALADTCRADGVPVGFAGGLEAPDVARLLLLAPDVLGFDTAVRMGHDPAGVLDVAALHAVRALFPSKTSASRSTSRTARDRLFVRNFVVPLSIGAYQAERGAHQRVRFSVEVDIARDPIAPRDMRDVFSYDIIIETIRRLSARAHVIFVETLAEEIAAALLAQPAVLSTIVSVEKLDIIDGEVGIEIHRWR